MKMKINLFLILVTAAIINSCSDCSLEPLTQLSCAPREATVTQFNANVTQITVKDSKGNDSTYLEPVAEFSIHSYMFPGNDATSGSTPNDFRFSNKSSIFYGTVPFVFNNVTYFAQYEQSLPFNNDINGDFLVVSEDLTSNPRSAKIRFNGFVKNIVAEVGNNFMKDNSKDFCSDIINKMNNDPTIIENIRKLKTNYGLGTVPQLNLTKADYKVYDIDGNVITDPAVIAAMPDAQVQGQIKGLNLKFAYDSDVQLGQIYYFQSLITGREFIFAITNIDNGLLAPFKNRLTIMFTALDRR